MPPCYSPTATFFSAADRPVELLSFGPDRDHAHGGDARRRRMAAMIARNIASAGDRTLLSSTALASQAKQTLHLPLSRPRSDGQPIVPGGRVHPLSM